MSISIDGVVIAEDLIEAHANSMEGVIIWIKALEDEGKRINDALKAIKKGDVVQVKGSRTFKNGVYKIGEIDFSLEDAKAPAIYSFKLDLKYT